MYKNQEVWQNSILVLPFYLFVLVRFNQKQDDNEKRYRSFILNECANSISFKIENQYLEGVGNEQLYMSVMVSPIFGAYHKPESYGAEP